MRWPRLTHMRLVIALFLLLFGGPACTNVRVGQHVAASDYAGSPQRIFIVNRMDASFSKSLPDGFATAAKQAFARCNVAVSVYRPDAAAANPVEQVKAELQTFRPDTTLTIQQTNRTLSQYGEVMQGTYVLILHDLARNRDIWRGVVSASALPYSSGGFLADRSTIGATVVDQLIRTMVDDNVLKTCPPSQPVDRT